MHRPQFSVHVYCGHGRPSQLLLSSCCYIHRFSCVSVSVIHCMSSPANTGTEVPALYTRRSDALWGRPVCAGGIHERSSTLCGVSGIPGALAFNRPTQPCCVWSWNLEPTVCCTSIAGICVVLIQASAQGAFLRALKWCWRGTCVVCHRSTSL